MNFSTKVWLSFSRYYRRNAEVLKGDTDEDGEVIVSNITGKTSIILGN